MIRSWKRTLQNVFLLSLLMPVFLASGSLHPPEAAPSRDAPPLILPRVVMFGDSITSGGRWSELLNSETIFNLGLKADNTEGFISRLPHVFAHKPGLCFIMGGVNDIAQGVPVERIFENYKLIVEALREEGITPVIQATLYTRRGNLNPRIQRLNKLLTEYAQKIQVEFLDLNDRFSAKGLLLRQFTFDGIHLRPEAYQQWGSLVLETIVQHASRQALHEKLQARAAGTGSW